MVEYLLGVSQSVLAAILYDAAAGRYRGFNSMLNAALADTGVYFGRVRGIEFNTARFRQILNGNPGAEALEALRGGTGPLDHQNLALVFARLGGVYFEDPAQTESVAREILQYFSERFERRLIEDPKTSAAVVLTYVRIAEARSAQADQELAALLEKLERQVSELPRRTVEELVKLPLSGYVSYDRQLQTMGRQRGVPPEQLKEEIDTWIAQVKEPYERGLAAVYQGRLAEAKRLLEQSIEGSRRDLGKKYEALGWAHLNGHDRKNAIAALRLAVEFSPEGVSCHESLAMAYSIDGDSLSAETSARRALELDPHNPRLLNSLGVSYQQRGEFDEAVACFQSALAIEPSVVPWVNLGNTLERQGNFGAAIAAFQSAIGLDSRCSPAFVGLASVHEKTGNIPEAIASLKRAIEIDPSEPAAYCNLGAVYCRQGDWQNAIECFRRAIALAPDFDNAHLNLARAWERVGRTDDAIREFRAVLAIDPSKSLAFNPQYGQAHAELAEVFVKQSCYQEAMAHAAQALEIDPRMLRAINILGVALQKQGRLEEAIERYRQALNVDPDFAVGHFNLASARALQGRRRVALVHLQRALELDPTLNEQARHDPDFEQMRADPEFRELIRG